MVIENLQTGYQVGKGWIDRVAELPEEDAGSAAGQAEVATEEEPAEAGEKTAEDDGDSADVTETDAPEEGGARAAPEEKFRVRQRMRFRVAEE